MALTLHYNFAEDRSLVARQGPTLSLTRATSGTFLGGNGYLQTAGNNEARYNYGPLGECQGLLVEEARTNLCLQSEDFTTSWTETSSPIVTANDAIAPDGNTTADKLEDANASGFSNLSQDHAYTSGQQRVASLFVKKDSVGVATRFAVLRLSFTGGTSTNCDLRFDTSTGDFDTEVISGSGNVLSGGVENYNSDYWRVYIGANDGSSSNTSVSVVIYPAAGNGDFSSYVNSVTGFIHAWGAQLEADSFPSSYIATTTTSATRNADVISSLLVTWYSAAGGTLYSDAHVRNSTAGSRIVVNIDDASTDNRVLHYVGGGEDAAAIVASGGTTQASFTSPANEYLNKRGRSAISFAADDVRFFSNGSQVGLSDISATMPSGISSFQIGQRTGTADVFNGTIREIAYWNEPSTNAILAGLTDGTRGVTPDIQDRRRRIIKRRRANAMLRRPRAEYWGGRRIR